MILNDQSRLFMQRYRGGCLAEPPSIKYYVNWHTHRDFSPLIHSPITRSDVDITGCPQAMRKRECCIGCEAILSRLTYSEEELELQKKSTALVLVDVFTSAILGKKEDSNNNKIYEIFIPKIRKKHPF